MRRSRVFSYFFGLVIIFAGIGILFDILGIKDFNPAGLFPFFFMFFALKLLQRGKRIGGSILLFIGVCGFLGYWFSINTGRVIGFTLSAAFIYLGYRMIRSKNKEIEMPSPSFPIEEQAFPSPDSEEHHSIHKESQQPQEDQPPFREKRERFEETKFEERSYREKASTSAFHTYSMGSPQNKHSLIGNLFLTGSRWDLHDMNIWHGIGDVKIDLSRAHINEGETIIIINGWIGDIDIYVPYDLDISLTASINFGDIDVFGNKQGGINRSMTLSTSGYRESSKRVRIVVSLLIGDIDVIYL